MVPTWNLLRATGLPGAESEPARGSLFENVAWFVKQRSGLSEWHPLRPITLHGHRTDQSHGLHTVGDEHWPGRFGRILRRVHVPVKRSAIFVFSLAACSPSPPPIHSDPPRPQPVAQAKDYGRLDLLPGKLAGLRLSATREPKTGELLDAWYYWDTPGRVAVVDALKNGLDARVQCDRSAGIKVKGEPTCGTSKGKKMRIGDRVICLDPEEKSVPAGVKPFGAFTAWAGLGDCSIQFAYGRVSDRATENEAVATTAAVADWMDRFLVPGKMPSDAELAANRKLLDVAIRAGRRR